VDITPGFIIWMVLVAAALLLLVADICHKEGKDRKAGRVVVGYIPEQPVEAAPPAPATPDVEAADAETRHWVAQGMRKLGYSAAEAKRMADTVPAGYSLQEGIEYCLYKRGAK
jgi:hypothetical protein